MEALARNSDKDLFKGLRVYKLGKQTGKNAEVFQRRKKSSYTQKFILKKYQSCLLSSKVGPGWLSVR